jgi:hypothetical protein
LTVQCNIDQRGRKARLVTGALVDGVGVMLILAGALRSQTDCVIAGAIVSLAGLFMIFEGVKGWCAVRAMGFKTKI